MKKLFPIFAVCIAIAVCLSLHITAKADDTFWSSDMVRAANYSSRDDNGKKIEIANAAELGLLAYEVNQGEQFEGYTIVLKNDIDLSGHNWDPIAHFTSGYIDSSVPAFRGCFDGNGYTISNMKIQISSVSDNNKAFGLFGAVVCGSIRNLSLTNAVVEIDNSEKHICAGVAAGFFAGSEVANITVTNSTITASGTSVVNVGGVSGCVYNSGTWDASSLKNVFASNITLSAATSQDKRRGGINGFANESRAEFNNCYVRDVRFAETAAQVKTDASGDIIGYGNLPVLNYCYYNGAAAVGVNGPYPPQISDISRESQGKLETPVTIKGEIYDMLVGALNAWVDNNSGSSDFRFRAWDCVDLGLKHDLEVICLDASSHELRCKNCSYFAEEGHKAVLRNQKDASCTDDGYSGDEVCSICNEVLKQGEVIPKLEHLYVNGKCTVCGAADPEYKKPGVTEANTDKSANAANGESKESKESKERDGIPRTGDEAPVALWVGILTAACIAVAGVCIYRKKNRHE